MSAITPTPLLFVQNQSWFRYLSTHHQARVVHTLCTLRGAKGDTVLACGERAQGWYGVMNGLVKIESQNQDRASSFAGLVSGCWFGEGALLKDEARRYNVVALRDSTVVCMPTAVFMQLYQESLAFNQYLVRNLNHKLGQTMAVIEAGRTRSPTQRVALSLSRLFWNEIRVLDLSQDELASMAGVARQTANRALRMLQERGIVTLSTNRITVRDDAALVDFVRRPEGDSTQTLDV
ncbi:MAG: Crp/Fnr family transcriptional regulator [Rhodoferax sp.]